MRAKNKGGATLAELILCAAIMAVVMLAVGAVMLSAFQSYARTAKIQEDEYNIRMAVLSISRQIRHGGVPDAIAPGSLSLMMPDGNTVTYTVNGGILERAGDSDVPFASVKLKGFTAVHNSGKDSITLALKGEHGLEVTMAVTMNRVRG